MVDDFDLSLPGGKGILGSLAHRDEADEDSPREVVEFVIEAGPQSMIRGTELFNRMMAHFGADAKAIRGVWRIGNHGKESTNIDKVNELTDAGLSLEVAVLYAWTVTRAQKLGFGKVTVEHVEGTPGRYTKIRVLIEKSSI
jgi:hypothetical protein